MTTPLNTPYALYALLFGAMTAIACSGTDSSFASSGGSNALGGGPGVGGATSAGGSAQSSFGGTTATAASGGALGAGGQGTSSGGNASTGGAVATGGIPTATGAASSTGGSVSTGGASLSTGGKSTAGATTTGGAPTSGGASSPTGGTRASGGASSSTGGMPVAGGTAGTGGSTSQGGTAGTGGSTLPPQVCDVPTPLALPTTSRVVGTGTAASCTYSALNTAVTAGGSITFNCGSAPVTIAITSAITVSKATVVDGAGLVALDGGGNNQIFLVASNYSLSVRNLTFINGKAPAVSDATGIGGAVLGNWRSQVEVIGCTFENNTAGCGGGGLSASGPAVR